MPGFLETLKKCRLFTVLEPKELERIFSDLKYSIKEYHREEVIAFEGNNCSALGIILEGRVQIQKTYSSGKVLTLTRLQAGDMFGEVIVFSQAHQYPATIVAEEKTRIMFIKDSEVMWLCRHYPSVLRSFMELLSNRILLLNKKIKVLSYETLRQKIALYLIEEYKNQKSLTLELDLSKKDWAEHMGVQRPSLSRELGNMQMDGLITCSRHHIKIKDIKALEELTY